MFDKCANTIQKVNINSTSDPFWYLSLICTTFFLQHKPTDSNASAFMCQTVGLVQDSTLLQFLAGGTEILCLVLKKYWWSIARPNQIQSRFHFKYLCGWWKSFCLTFVPLSNWSLGPDCIWYPQAFSVAPRDKATTSPGQSCKPPGGANISFSWSRIHHEE